MKKSVLVVALLVVFLASAFAQGNLLQAKIPFDFVVGGKTLPAGNYEFKAANHNYIQIRNLETGKVVQLQSVTRLAADKSSGTARISFDVQEGKHFIEAIWPEQDEGYLLHSVKGQHTHDMVSSK
jgi:hypothetical protein